MLIHSGVPVLVGILLFGVVVFCASGRSRNLRAARQYAARYFAGPPRPYDHSTDGV